MTKKGPGPSRGRLFGHIERDHFGNASHRFGAASKNITVLVAKNVANGTHEVVHTTAGLEIKKCELIPASECDRDGKRHVVNVQTAGELA